MDSLLEIHNSHNFCFTILLYFLNWSEIKSCNVLCECDWKERYTGSCVKYRAPTNTRILVLQTRSNIRYKKKISLRIFGICTNHACSFLIFYQLTTVGKTMDSVEKNIDCYCLNNDRHFTFCFRYISSDGSRISRRGANLVGGANSWGSYISKNLYVKTK